MDWSMKKVLKWIGGGFLALMILGIFVNATKTPEEKAAEQATRENEQAARAAAQAAKAEAKTAAAAESAKQKLASLPAVTARDIAGAYNDNTVAADQVFKGKEFKVSGTVSDINTDILGRPYVTLRGGVNEFMEPQFAFDKSASGQLAKLKKGAKVTMVCTGKGDVAKIPLADSCTLISS
jgi:hypothetical protein